MTNHAVNFLINFIILATGNTIFCFDLRIWLEIHIFEYGDANRDPTTTLVNGYFVSGIDLMGANSGSPVVVTIMDRGLFFTVCLIGKVKALFYSMRALK